MKSGVYKVTVAHIRKTKRGFEIYELHLNNTIIATSFIPFRAKFRNCSELYKLYAENKNCLGFLIGKYIYLELYQSEYGDQFHDIDSFDVLKDFKNKLDSLEGTAFTTHIPIYDFLSNMQGPIESDGIIKVTSNFGDMQLSKIGGYNVCCQYDVSDENLPKSTHRDSNLILKS